MKIAILLGVVMVIIAIIIKTGWRPSRPNVSWSWTRTLVTILALLLLLGLGSCFYWRDKTPPPPTVSVLTEKNVPSFTDATTPATLTLDFHFRIESDGPVNIEYPGEKPMLYTPGKGFQQLPQPKQSGPKIFTDPTDPKNGHISFRIYPIR